MKISKNGFTVAEMLICFTVIGILASMLIPSIVSNKPNKNMAMVKKAYQMTERAVLELISDENNFPADGANSTGLAYFDSSNGVRTQENTGKFFCEQFASRLNTNNRINCDVAGDDDPAYHLRTRGVGSAATPGKESFTTNDGIYWYIGSKTILCDPNDTVANDPDESPCVFPPNVTSGNPRCPNNAQKSPFICIYYDVNGFEGPNRMMASTGPNGTYGGSPPSSDFPRVDRGWFYVYWNGKVVVPMGQIERYLNKTDVFDNK